MILLILLPLLILGWSPGEKNAEGNALYRKGQYDGALEAYQTAQADAPDNAALSYNLGNTLYRKQKYPEAIQAYRQAIQGKDALSAQAYYNLGNSLFRAGQSQQAIEAYKQGLRITPDDVDMKYNLEFVQRQQKNQDQQRQNQKDQSKDDGRQDNPQDQKQDQNRPDQSSPPPDRPKQNDRSKAQPRKGELSKEEAERLLNALNQDEQDLQKQIRKQGPAGQKNPDKDW